MGKSHGKILLAFNDNRFVIVRNWPFALDQQQLIYHTKYHSFWHKVVFTLGLASDGWDLLLWHRETYTLHQQTFKQCQAYIQDRDWSQRYIFYYVPLTETEKTAALPLILNLLDWLYTQYDAGSLLKFFIICRSSVDVL